MQIQKRRPEASGTKTMRTVAERARRAVLLLNAAAMFPNERKGLFALNAGSHSAFLLGVEGAHCAIEGPDIGF